MRSSCRPAGSSPLCPHVYNRAILILLIALLGLTAVRIAVASTYPLGDDETYYWVWSRHLAWGYPDHPPAVAAMVRVTTALVGDSALGVRLGPIVLALISTFLLYDLARRMFDHRAAVVAAIGYQVLPLAAVGAIFAAPDAPFIFFWLLAVWFLWQARTGHKRWAWLAGGLAVGLCLMSKMSALFLAGPLVGFFLFSRADRQWLRRAEPYAAALVAILMVLPLIVWNGRHDWIMFGKTFNPIPWINLDGPAANAAAFFGATTVYYGPLTLGFLLVALVESVRLAGQDARFALLSWLALPLVAFTFATSFDGIPKPHWPAPAYLMLLIAAAALWETVRDRPWWRRAVLAGMALNLIAIVVLYAVPFFPSSPAARRLRGWDQAAARVARMMDGRGNPEWFILAGSYQNASQLAYHLRERYPITTPRQDNQIAMQLDPEQMLDHNAIFITDHQPGPGLPLHLMFRKLEARPAIEIQTGAGLRRFQVYFGYGFRGEPRPRIFPI